MIFLRQNDVFNEFGQWAVDPSLMEEWSQEFPVGANPKGPWDR